MQNWVSRTFWSTYHDSSAIRRELAALLGEPLLLSPSHQIHGQDPRGVPHFQSTVDVKTYQYYQSGPSL